MHGLATSQLAHASMDLHADTRFVVGSHHPIPTNSPHRTPTLLTRHPYTVQIHHKPRLFVCIFKILHPALIPWFLT